MEQSDKVPSTVYLQVRHLSGSYFRAGDNTIKYYRQPLGAYRKIKFDRFTISDESKCLERKRKGQNTSKRLWFVLNSFSKGFQIFFPKAIRINSVLALAIFGAS